MRLIDADKYLEKVCTYKETGCGSCKLQTICPKDAPTVKAIPIEWIRNYHMFHLMPKPVEWFEAIEIMLEDWEKENGKSNTNS